jgi:hypothetical protein
MALGSVLNVLTPELERIKVNQGFVFKIVGGIIAFAFLYYVVFPKVGNFFKWRVQVADVPYNVPNDGSVDTKMNAGKYQGFVQQLYTTLTASYSVGWGATERCRAFERWVRELNPNEFRYCANVYKNTYRTSIRQAIEETAYTGCWGTDYATKFKQRINALSIP